MIPEFEPRSRSDWRRWLEHHHGSALTGVWLLLRKKSAGDVPVSLDDAVEEALCFGWIDSAMHRHDEKRIALKFTPRRAGGTWAASNKRRVALLEERGLMTDAGRRVIAQARQDGSWTLLDDVEALVVPPDLQAAFEADALARANFDGFTPSQRRQILFWIASARRPATRAQRIADTVRLASQNRRAGGGGD